MYQTAEEVGAADEVAQQLLLLLQLAWILNEMCFESKDL